MGAQRAAGKNRRQKITKRREDYFELLVSGYSVAQIAAASKVNPSTVRRAIGQALAERRPHSQEDFVRLQVARLNKALRCADVTLEEGDMTAIAPFLQVMGSLTVFTGSTPPLR